MYSDTRGREHRSDAAMRGYNFSENTLIGHGLDRGRLYEFILPLTSLVVPSQHALGRKVRRLHQGMRLP